LTVWRKLSHRKIWLPLAAGLIIAGLLAYRREGDNNPWLTLIGFILSIGLLFYGFYNIAAASKRSVVTAAVLFVLAAAGVAHTLVFWFRGDLNDSPGVGGLIIIISICLAVIGVKFLRRRQ